MLTAADIVRFDDAPPPPGASAFVAGAPEAESIAIVPADPGWAEDFEHLARLIREALGERALGIEHVGSTSVPGLPAKPIVDIDLTVADSADEAAWLPPLEAAGFVLTIREPWWYEHRCLRFGAPRCNLHVFSPDCPEAARHKIFRDWLRANAEDRALYRDAKVAAAEAANAEGEHVMQYNARKQQVIRDIYTRAFAAAGLV
ncbi:GrpB family protein [Georgenia alba]|uniref:GrpB family protein n=1 Tax=Georgenia alba TaxID=2233858 RepID=A0ABW2Q719_9MICO